MPATAATAPSQLCARNQPIEKLCPAASRHRLTSEVAMAMPNSAAATHPVSASIALTGASRP